MIKILESISDDKFNQIKELANKYDYKLDILQDTADDFLFKPKAAFGFTVSYGIHPGMIKPDIYIGGIVNTNLSTIDYDIDKLNIAIQLANEIKSIIDNENKGE